MFALEQSTHYDPSRPAILDGRPLSTQIPRQSSPVRTSDVVRKENIAPNTSSSPSRLPVKSQTEHAGTDDSLAALSPSRLNVSPTKSSLAKKGAAFRRSGFNPDTGIWEDDEEDILKRQLPAGRGLHRHQKSVTFDQAPPQVNEYEETTPAPSSIGTGSRAGSYDDDDDDDENDEDDEASFERGSSMDHDDSFDASLEDTEKTPVVLPEDWRFMSPDTANTDLALHQEDVFEEDYGSPAPTAQPGNVASRPNQFSASSVDSNGQARPLPPLPPPSLGAHNKTRSDSLTGAFERMSVASRSLPSPPAAASTSKADILKIGVSSSLSAEDRLRLMALQEQERERRMRRMPAAKEKEHSPVRSTSDEDSTLQDIELPPVLSESRNATPQLSRDSILAGLRGRVGTDSRESSEDIPDQHTRRDLASLDPDVPIPSMEDPTQPRIKEEAEETDLYSIPDMYSHRSASDSQASVNNNDDLTSEYSQPSLASFPRSHVEEEHDTPKAQSPVREQPKTLTSERVSLPEFSDFGVASSFDVGLSAYLSNKEDKPKPTPIVTGLPDLAALRQNIQRSYTPDPQPSPQFANAHQYNPQGSAPGTPESVVRHSSTLPSLSQHVNREEKELPPAPSMGSDRSFSPSEASETGSVLVSGREMSPISPISAEFEKQPEVMVTEPADQHVSTETTVQPPENKRVSSLVPLDIPQASLSEGLGFGLEKEFDRVVEAQKVEFELSLQCLHYPFNGRFPSCEVSSTVQRKASNPTENVPFLPKPRGARPLAGNGPLICPEDEASFANRAGRRQRGYLMRQNTKIVVASERISHDEPRSPGLPTLTEDGLLGIPAEANRVLPSARKTSQPTWTAEPWNGKSRRKSIRVGGEKTVSKRKPVEGAVPPLPGQASNAQEALDAVAEDELGEEEDWEEGAERGRLFVKVVGVKDLQMPFPQRE
jgi:hypothetical protein